MPAVLQQSIAVIGAGIAGLASAIRLREAGYDVRIFARETGQGTVSAVAAALWKPFAAEPREKIEKWCSRTYRVFVEQSQDPDSGVDAVNCNIFLRRGEDVPYWLAAAENASVTQFPTPHINGATGEYRFRSYVADMRFYLDYLQKHFESLGGTISHADFACFDEAFAYAPVVVNCTGLGSALLARDSSVHPARGVVLTVTPKVTVECFSDNESAENLTYIIPRRDCVVLGGTYNENRTELSATDEEVAEIFRRCCALHPPIARTKIENVKVGLRPVRPSIRLEKELRPDGGILVHNYGHGGSGVTVSWGCAEEVVALLGA